MIFICNLPPESNEEYVKELLADAGEVVDVAFSKVKSGNVNSAHVTFANTKSVNKIKSLKPPTSAPILDEEPAFSSNYFFI